ncbi:MAG: phospholipid carrier-dependent glycosyltransferase [Kiritimatiellaeota bacterium]|nr:phospholipid carrier-dependent glycosyltransferase [Kiritimatiellota bacterium]
MKTRTLLLLFLLLFLGKALLLEVIPLTDPSEGRYASIALTMARSGDFLMPRIWKNGQLVPFMGKPALGFWLMAASINLFGVNEFAVRLPGFLACVLLLGIMFFVLRRYHSEYVAWAALLVAGSTTSFYLLSGAVLVDAFLALFAVGAVFWYYAFLRESRGRLKRAYSLLVFLFLGFGVLAKGPVALVYFGVPVFFWTLFNHQWRTLRDHVWWIGAPLFLGVCIPWFVLAEKSHPGFLRYFLVNENFMRFYARDYGDLYGAGRKLPYGSALLLMFVCSLPWVLVPVWMVWRRRSQTRTQKRLGAIRRETLRALHDGQFGDSLFFSGVLFVTLFWCLARQLMLYYLIPLVPLFAVWCALILRRLELPVRRIALGATGFVAFYALIAFPVSAYLSRVRSTQEVLEQVRLNWTPHGRPPTRIVFVRRMPYSAYFYARSQVVPHGKEAVADSFRRGLALGEDCIFVSPERYLRRMPESLSDRVKVWRRVGPWVIATCRKDPGEVSVARADGRRAVRDW